MKIRIACLDKESLWVIDDVIEGLYCINRKSSETKCVIDFRELFSYEGFKAQSLIKWKEDYIVVVPQDIGKNWIFYNKATGEITCRKIVSQNYREIMVSVAQDRNQFYFCPVYMNDPILIIDSDTLMCLQEIKNWNRQISNDCLEGAWTGAYDGQYFFYPQKNTKILVRLNCETQRIDLLKLDITENIIAIDYAFGELWVLPINGNRIYQIDENGRVIFAVDLLLESTDLVPNFARIIVQKKYLFLLPCYHKGIYIYDKLKRRTYIILGDNLEEGSKEVYLRYWEYCIVDNQICFLPFMDKFIEIDLDTLVYKKKDIYYPNIWTSNQSEDGENRKKYINKSNSGTRIANGCDLEIFMYYVQNKTNMKTNSKNGYQGKKIWDMLKRGFARSL